MNGIPAAFSLGSNLGDRLSNLRAARDTIAALDGVTVRASAPVYETDPVGCPDEFRDLPYLNTVVLVGTELSVHRLFDEVSRIETALGRRRTGRRNTPRTIDIDLVFYASETVRSSGLVVPHPRFAERRFVLQPLADLLPREVLPGQTLSVRELLDALPPDAQPVRLVARIW